MNCACITHIIDSRPRDGRRRWTTLECLVVWLSIIICSGNAQAQHKIEIDLEHVRGHVYAAHGPGGTIGVSIGEDGVYLIDDQFKPVTPKLKDAIAEITDKPIRFVINTHWHGDHTGANQDYGTTGTLIVAHDNVRVRMSSEQFLRHIDVRVPPSPVVALPVATFSNELSLHFNGDEARAIHTPNAHTDGDSIIVFRSANIIHMGDVYFSSMYPFVDVSSGGHVDGVLNAVSMALENADEDTRFIAGHGPVTGRKELLRYLEDARKLRDWVAGQIDQGANLEDVTAADSDAPVNPELGGFPGESDAAGFARGVYISLTGKWE